MSTPRISSRRISAHAGSACWMVAALAAVGLCSCRAGWNASPAAPASSAVPSAAPAASAAPAHLQPSIGPQANVSAPGPAAPQADCPCCAGESDYAKFSAQYERQHRAYPVQQAAHHAELAPAPHGPPTLPPSAWTGAPHDGYTHPTAHPAQYPYGVPAGVGAWAPPGIQRPWPHDEWIFDGGDKRPHVAVSPDWTVHGLQLEDTVAHFDTLDGRTLVEPANRVPIYAPRFAAVRKVYGLEAHHHRTPPLVHDRPVQAVVERDAAAAIDADQYLHMRTNLGVKSPIINLERRGPVTLEVELTPETFVGQFAAYENFQLIREGIFEASEKARLAQMVDAALVWSEKQAPQVILDKTQAAISVAEARPQVTVQYELAGKPRLRIVKVANRTEARPGDIVEFTLRFDNIGTQGIGNVTIIDNLTTRLEYVPDSAQSSRRANFLTEENYGDSLVLRWEILDPMQPGEGGVIRFRCRVR